jgi:peptidoglycan hydrolase-like protein with peptidoglycan-binding domain
MSRSDDRVSAEPLVPAGQAPYELAYRRSLDGSLARRAAASLRRRRVLRGRRSVLAATAGLLILSAAAVAGTGGAPAREGLDETTIAAIQRALGIDDDGVLGPATRQATKRFQRAHGLKADGLLGPQTLQALGLDPDHPQATPAPLDPRLAQIAQCESAGDPTAVSSDGRYGGKYQFTRETWRRVGGQGDPARASEREQDRRAARLLAQEGTAPWPKCGDPGPAQADARAAALRRPARGAAPADRGARRRRGTGARRAASPAGQRSKAPTAALPRGARGNAAGAATPTPTA